MAFLHQYWVEFCAKQEFLGEKCFWSIHLAVSAVFVKFREKAKFREKRISRHSYRETLPGQKQGNAHNAHALTQ